MRGEYDAIITLTFSGLVVFGAFGFILWIWIRGK